VVEDSEVDPTVRRAAFALVVVGLLLGASLAGVALLSPAAVGAGPAVSSGVHPDAASPLRGNITGPTVVALNSNERYLIQATGGPAVAANGSIIGNLTYYASVTGPNPTGVMITPQSAAILAGTPGRPLLEAGSIPQTLTITVELASVLNASNETLNLTYTVTVVQPYVVAAELVNPNNATVESFPVIIDLDGAKVGNVSVPDIQAHSTYNLTFDYAADNLSSGWHTFTIYLTEGHGLVRFANGSTSYSESFYLPGPQPDYTIWYVLGVVAFLGVLFIFGARVGARRRGPSRK
jgi:hypothetical protein